MTVAEYLFLNTNAPQPICPGTQPRHHKYTNIFDMNEKESRVKLQRIAKEVDKTTKKDVLRVAGVTVREFLRRVFIMRGLPTTVLISGKRVIVGKIQE